MPENMIARSPPLSTLDIKKGLNAKKETASKNVTKILKAWITKDSYPFMNSSKRRLIIGNGSFSLFFLIKRMLEQQGETRSIGADS